MLLASTPKLLRDDVNSAQLFPSLSSSFATTASTSSMRALLPAVISWVPAKGKRKKISAEVLKEMSSKEVDNYYIAITSIPGQKKPAYFPYERNNDGHLNSLSTESHTE